MPQTQHSPALGIARRSCWRHDFQNAFYIGMGMRKFCPPVPKMAHSKRLWILIGPVEEKGATEINAQALCLSPLWILDLHF